jgi:hypothetical protein
MTRLMRLVLSITVALVLLAGLAPGVGAGEDWCEADPLVIIPTEYGPRALYVTTGARGTLYSANVLAAEISFTTRDAGPGATRVFMDVLVRGYGSVETRTAVSTGPMASGTVYDSAKGVMDKTMQMEFTLN